MTRTEVNNALAGILQAQIDIPEHLQANQLMLDYTEQLVTGAITGNTWPTDKPNYYTKAQTDTYLNGKADLVGGLVPSNQLPSFVDDVLEFANLAAFPATGTTGKIYVATDTNFSYRWSGSTYIQIISGNFILNQTASAQPSSGFWIDGTGRVASLGIGTAPSYPLHVSGQTSSISLSTSHSINAGGNLIAAAGAGIVFAGSLTNVGYSNSDVSIAPLQDIVFKPGNAEKGRFTTGGTLNLGTSGSAGIVQFIGTGGSAQGSISAASNDGRTQITTNILQLQHNSGQGIGNTFEFNARNPIHLNLGGMQRLKILGSGNGSTPSFLQLYSADAASTSNNIGLDFRLNRTTGGETVFARMATYSSNIGNTTYQGYLSFQLANAAAVAEQMKLSHNGVLTVNDSILVGTGNSGVSFQLGTFGAADYFIKRSGTALIQNTGGSFTHTIANNSWYAGLTAIGHSWYDGASTPVLLMRLQTNGQFSLSNIPHATTDTDKFLVSDAGVVKYRTAAELLSELDVPTSWAITGNTGTDSGIHFIGTADDQDVVVKRNNVEAIKVIDAGITISPLAGENNRMVYVDDEGTLKTTYLPPGTIITETEDYESVGGDLSSYFGITSRNLIDFTVDESEEVEFDYQMYSAFASNVTFNVAAVTSAFEKLDVTIYRKTELEDDWVEEDSFNLSSWMGIGVVSESYLRVTGRLKATTADTVRATISTFESSMNSGGVSDVTLRVTRFIAGSPFGEAETASGWALTGNAGTDANINFIGTSDDNDVVFKRNGVERIRFNEDATNLTGHVNIGGEVFNPANGLDINYSYDDSGIVDSVNVDIKPEGLHFQSSRGTNPASTEVYINGDGLEVSLTGEGYSANCNLFDNNSTFGNSFDDGLVNGAVKIDFNYAYDDIGSTAAIVRARQDVDQEMSVEVRPESVSIKHNEDEVLTISEDEMIIAFEGDDDGDTISSSIEHGVEGFELEANTSFNLGRAYLNVYPDGVETFIEENSGAKTSWFDQSVEGISIGSQESSISVGIEAQVDSLTPENTAISLTTYEDSGEGVQLKVTPESVAVISFESATPVNRLTVAKDGEVTVSNLAGSGTRMVVADADGVLGSQAVPSSGTFTPSIAGEENTVTGSTVVSGMMYSQSVTGDIVTCSGVVILQSTGAVLTNVVKFTLPTGLADNLFGVCSAVDGTSGIVVLEDNIAKLMVLAPDTATRYMYYQFQYHTLIP